MKITKEIFFRYLLVLNSHPDAREERWKEEQDNKHNPSEMKMKLIVEKDGGVVKHISMHIKYSSLEEDIFFGDQ